MVVAVAVGLEELHQAAVVIGVQYPDHLVAVAEPSAEVAGLLHASSSAGIPRRAPVASVYSMRPARLRRLLPGDGGNGCLDTEGGSACCSPAGWRPVHRPAGRNSACDSRPSRPMEPGSPSSGAAISGSSSRTAARRAYSTARLSMRGGRSGRQTAAGSPSPGENDGYDLFLLPVAGGAAAPPHLVGRG